MPYYGIAGDGGSGGNNDHRLLVGRQDANQHPAAAVSVAPIGPLDTESATVQQALEALAGRGGAEEITAVATVAVGAFKAVAFRPDGKIEPADHANPAHLSRVAGITAASAATGAEAKVRVSGLLSFNGWSWVPGRPVYVGINGGLTQTPPVTGFVQQIGIATGVDALLAGLGILIRRK